MHLTSGHPLLVLDVVAAYSPVAAAHALRNWMAQLSAALDCFSWLFVGLCGGWEVAGADGSNSHQGNWCALLGCCDVPFCWRLARFGSSAFFSDNVLISGVPSFIRSMSAFAVSQQQMITFFACSS